MVRALVALVVASAAVASSGCAALIAIGIGMERGKAHVFSHSDVLADGTEVVYYQRVTEHPKATVVLLHGFGANRDHWTRFVAMLPDDVDVIAPDLPGCGESTKDTALSYDIDSQSRRLHAFLTQRGLKRFHVMGNSMGGHLAAYYALVHPENVQSLVLFDPGGVAKSVAQQNGIPLVVRTEADFDALLKGSFVKPPQIPGIVKQHFVDQSIANAEFAAKIRKDTDTKPQPLTDRIALIKPATLVVWGDTDHILDVSSADVWRDRLALGDVVIMKETGHAPMLERPEESVALVLTWWRARGLVQ